MREVCKLLYERTFQIYINYVLMSVQISDYNNKHHAFHDKLITIDLSEEFCYGTNLLVVLFKFNRGHNDNLCYVNCLQVQFRP